MIAVLVLILFSAAVGATLALGCLYLMILALEFGLGVPGEVQSFVARRLELRRRRLARYELPK